MFKQKCFFFVSPPPQWQWWQDVTQGYFFYMEPSISRRGGVLLNFLNWSNFVLCILHFVLLSLKSVLYLILIISFCDNKLKVFSSLDEKTLNQTCISPINLFFKTFFLLNNNWWPYIKQHHINASVPRSWYSDLYYL